MMRLSPPNCRREVERELSRLELALQHIAEVEAVMSADAEELAGQVLEQSASDEAVTALEKLTCVGRALSSWREVFCRDFS